MKKILFVGLVALSGAIGCSNNDTSNQSPDLAMQQQMMNPDMAPSCFSGTPMTDTDFLNACTTASSVEITPFYPDNAPNGTLPPLN